MNDVRRVLDDDALLDRLSRGERPDDAGPAEDLLLALCGDALVAVDDGPLPVLPAAPAPRVVRLRGALAGSLVAAAVLAGTSGVAAAVTGDPFAGLSGVREAARAAAAPAGRDPLLRSREGARLHLEVERVADLIAAGRVDDARDALAAMPSLLSGLGASEQRLLRAELATTAPDLVEAAGLVEPGSRPGGAGGRPGQPDAPVTQLPDVDGDEGAGASKGPALPTQAPPRAPTTTPTTATKPPKTTKPPTSGQPTLPTTPPVSTPPVTPPPTSAPSASASAAPTGTAAPTASPTTQAARRPGQGPGQGGGSPSEPGKPPKTQGAGNPSVSAPTSVAWPDLSVRLPVTVALLLVGDPSGAAPTPG